MFLRLEIHPDVSLRGEYLEIKLNIEYLSEKDQNPGSEFQNEPKLLVQQQSDYKQSKAAVRAPLTACGRACAASGRTS